MSRREPLAISVILVLSIVLPVLSNNGPSLRGVLQALERRRRAPPGISYPLSSFQYPERALEYLEANPDELSENEPGYFDLNDDRRKKALMLNYLDKDLDYPSDDFGLSHKKSAFRERLGELKARRKKIMEKKRSSAFRERAGKHEAQNEQLKELFLNELAEEEERENEEAQLESDAQYAEMLKELWERYKYARPDMNPAEISPRWSNKKRTLRKRQIPGEFTPVAWGTPHFKKKRSPNQRLDNDDTPNDFLYSLKFISQSDPSVIENLKDEKISDEGEDPDVSSIIFNKEQDPRYSKFEGETSDPSDIRDEYLLSLQPINNEDIPNEEETDYSFAEDKKKRFPVSKRSGILARRDLVKRNLNTDKRSAGTNSKVMKDLSSIFGISNFENHEAISKPVKRSSVPDENSHEIKAPTAGILANHHHEDPAHAHNNSHDEHHDHAAHEHPHSRHEHENKPPLLSAPISNDNEHSHEDTKILVESQEKSQLTLEHPIILKKKSIDWSNYFGIDRRRKKSYENAELNSIRDLYRRNAKRNLDQYGAGGVQLLNEPFEEPINEEGFERKQKTKQIEELKLDNMDNKLKNMESVIVDEALQYSGNDESLDTKEQQEIKEKILSRLAAAYSLEKMRKALKEFKTSLQSQRKLSDAEEDKEKQSTNPDEMKKKKKSSLPETSSEQNPDNNEGLKDKLEMDFEGEQGAGHYLNGPDEPLSEGYMGGSGMRNKPNHFEGLENGQCPVLNHIVSRCQSIDILAGDYGQLFLPLCSLHQICYLCGPSSPTGCDLIFLSEADSLCGGRTKCQQTARTTLMVLRDEHDSLADDMEGECDQGSCLYQTLNNNSGWQHIYKR